MARRTQRTENAALLATMRSSPDYYSGKLIDAAADVAMQVGRRPHRQGGFYAGRQAVAAVERDYEAIDAHYESQLKNSSALGWEQERS
jgi:hypothetical protein